VSPARCAAVGLAVLLGGSSAPAQTVAIVGGTVHPVSGPPLEGATVLIRDGRIVAVGADVAVPAGAVRIDAAGRWVTPGLILTGTMLGVHLLDVGGQLETREDSLLGEVKPSFNVADAIDPASPPIPSVRLEGITTALAVPSTGLIPGQGVLYDLADAPAESLIVRSPAAMVLDFSQGGKAAAGGSRAGILKRIRELFRDAREYERRRADFRRAGMQPLSASADDLDALLPVLAGRVPVLAIANRRSDIENALRISREFNLRLVLWQGAEAWQVAGDLARAGVPVVVRPLTNIPSFDQPSPRLDNATLLRAAGVNLVISQGEDDAFHRNLRFSAGNAVRNGLAWTDALRAVTLGPAEAAGVADRYGTLEPGKVANIVVWSGDPFEFSTRAERVFIRGAEAPRASRQIELRERYRTLPPAY
jgi:imidazolonepropionase-like amidohydrolase